MPLPLLAIAGGSAAVSLVGAFAGNRKRKKAARARADANNLQRKDAAIQNELSRRRAVTQQRAAVANAKASAAASGVLGSASSAGIGALDSQLAVNIARQKQKQAIDTRTSQLDQHAQRNDARAAFTEGLASTASSLISSIPTG